MGHFSEQTYYEILEVSPEATAEEIQRAFFKAKSTYSPNSPALYSVFTEDEAKLLLRVIDEAYSVLSNHAKRRDYDKTLFFKGGESTIPNTSASVTPISAGPTDMANELPDFMLPGQDSGGAPASSFHVNISAGLAEDLGAIKRTSGKTLMSHYDQDEEFEKEIENQAVFDGTFLQKVRLYKNISLDQISETSRISRPYILAVETNDFHALPAAVYVRGFIVAIAKLLGLKEKKVVESYMKLFKDSRGK